MTFLDSHVVESSSPTFELCLHSRATSLTQFPTEPISTLFLIPVIYFHPKVVLSRLHFLTLSIHSPILNPLINRLIN